MNEELKKYQDLVSGLVQKLDAERQRASRLEHELSRYRDGKSLAYQLAEKDDIINKQKQTIDKLNAQLDWLKRKVWGQSSEKRSSSYDPARLTFDFGDLSVSPEEEEGKPPVTPVLHKSNFYHQLVPSWCESWAIGYEFGRVGPEKALFIYIFPIEGQ